MPLFHLTLTHHDDTRYEYSGNELSHWTKDRYYATTFDHHVSEGFYTYDPHGDLTQEVIKNYSNNVTTTVNYTWTWQAGAYRLCDYVSSAGVTMTFEYDRFGRIQRRSYNGLGYSEWTYVEGTDWLLKETWHSAISPYRVFDLIRYWYTNGRPSRVEWWSGPADMSNVSSYNLRYLQFNWHGDTAVWVDSGGGSNNNGWTTNDPFGIYTASTPTDYYYWNGGWGYLYFSKLNLYYAHGRWYNPNTALWLSPDEKGEYVYGSGQDAVNWYVGQFWANARWGYQQFQQFSQATVEPLVAAGKSSPEAKEVVLGAGQFVVDTAMASHYAMLPPSNWTLWDRVGNATRATVPVVTAEGMVVFGLPALEETGSYLYRSLLGRLTTGPVTAGLRGLRLSPHALQRMAQRGVSLAELEKAISSPDNFQYFHDSVWKTGYYDPISKIFVGTVNNIITTVITNVKPQYIENLKRLKP